MRHRPAKFAAAPDRSHRHRVVPATIPRRLAGVTAQFVLLRQIGRAVRCWHATSPGYRTRSMPPTVVVGVSEVGHDRRRAAVDLVSELPARARPVLMGRGTSTWCCVTRSRCFAPSRASSPPAPNPSGRPPDRERRRPGAPAWNPGAVRRCDHPRVSRSCRRWRRRRHACEGSAAVGCAVITR